MSRKINIVLFSILIILVFAPFFQMNQSNESDIYVNALCLMPGLSEIGNVMYSENSGFSDVYNSSEGIQYIILIIFPVLGLIASIFCEFSKDKKIKALLEIICYTIAFIVFIFLILSIKSIGDYKLSFGYFGTVFVYALLFAVKILSYLLESSPQENEIWGETEKWQTNSKNKKRNKKTKK